MVRWMCGVSLKNRKRSVDLKSLLDVQSVDEVVRRGRLRWFGHVERKSGDDCRNVVVAGVRCAGRGRKTWYECGKNDMKALGLPLNGQCSGICGGASFREERLTLVEHGKIDVFKINDDDDDIYKQKLDHIYENSSELGRVSYQRKLGHILCPNILKNVCNNVAIMKIIL